MTLGKVLPIKIEDEMRNSYLDYAMSVIISRALPDVRDGMKPVHRRILFAMNDMGITASSAYKKSARIVGEVLGKYHPHGDSSVYDAMVRMAQPFSMRYMLVDGQGNFGSIDNDPPAAMRYTEARLSHIAGEMLMDIDKDTVDFVPNFDESLKEPTVLPTRIPNLLLNGAAGIAVGMATNIPPHNLTEICNAIQHLIEFPEASVDELMKFVPGPDFPTYGVIQGQDEIRNAYATGRGKLVVRAKSFINETDSGRMQIIITELPYQTDKSALVARIADLVKDKTITGIADLRDESDRSGIRVVIDLKRGEANPQHIQNMLYKHTGMQTGFFINMLALVDGQPKVISLREALQYFIDFRTQVITRRSRFELKQAQDRAHILEGLRIALDHIDAVIKTIRESQSAEEARGNLMQKFGLSQPQAQAILDMQLRRLANMERQKILDEYAELLKRISYLEDLLANTRQILAVIKEEMSELKSRYGDARRTEISSQAVMDFGEIDVPHEQVVVTLSNRGFVKRVPAKVYKLQHRGGKGIIGIKTREADAVRLLAIADTHDTLLFFTTRGRVYSVKTHELPSDSSRTAKGLAIINVFPITEGEKVTAMVVVPAFAPDMYLLMATKGGEVKKTAISYFSAVRSSGIIATDLPAKDELCTAVTAMDQDEVLMITQKGKASRFKVAELRASSRTSGGVRGIRLDEGDAVVSMDVAVGGAYVLIISYNGYGKLTHIEDYPTHHRGSTGVKTLDISEKTGDVAASRVVMPQDELMIITAEGIVIRTPVKEKDGRGGIRTTSRIAQGVTIQKMEGSDKVVAITAFDSEKE